MKNIYTIIDIDGKFRCSKRRCDVGEWFKFRIHYGFVNAGYATLEVKRRNNKKTFHVVGKDTTGMSPFFLKWTTCMKVISIKSGIP
jgi:hypothetical protein